jgi:hypothetical protein
MISCSKVPVEQQQEPKQIKDYKNLELSEDFKAYWFDGTAELSSYRLTQMRYGEPRNGNAVLIFVKEPFLKSEQVKANRPSEASVDVLKLNYTKNFNTGIYPYSIMQSVFSPLTAQPHAIKVATSTQEWCGQTYMQLNNKGDFEIESHSYFEGEDDQKLNLQSTFLENELWTKLRIDPIEISTGELNVIPDFSYLRLKHQPVKSYKANLSQDVKNDTLITRLEYSELNRQLVVFQENIFPYKIVKWQEKEGNDQAYTEAIINKTMKTDYWNKNANKFEFLRDSLGL